MAEAVAFVQADGSCHYENFVRRRGKGKKTLQKEVGETSVEPQDNSRSGSSEHAMNAMNTSVLWPSSIQF
jgi:hypothetical protein